MKNNWKKTSLKNLCVFKKNIIHLEGNINYYLYSLPAFDNNKTPEKLQGKDIKSSKYKVNNNTILFNKLNLRFKRIWKIYNAKENSICSTEFIPITVKNIDFDYLYYFLFSNQTTNTLNAMSIGTSNSHQRIDPEYLYNYEITYPNIKTQQKIAKILSAFDDKIELNNKINKNLEQQAQAIFKDKIINQCNNKNGIIGDYCCVKSGFAFKSTWWGKEGVKVIKIKNINNDSINLTDCSFVNKDKVQYAKEFIVKGGDLLIAMTGATIGKFAIVPKTNEILLVNQRVGKFFLGENPNENLPFLYCTLKEQDIITEIINKGQGSAQANISGNDIMMTSCYIPNRDIIQSFNKTCKPLFENIIMNNYENEQLANLRDFLLPKLMNGEIDVKNINI